MADTPAKAVRGAELVVLAVPPGPTLDLIGRLAPMPRARSHPDRRLQRQGAGHGPGAPSAGWATASPAATRWPAPTTPGSAAARPDRLRGCVVYVCESASAEGPRAARGVMRFWEEVLEAHAHPHRRRRPTTGSWRGPATFPRPWRTPWPRRWPIAGWAGCRTGPARGTRPGSPASSPDMWLDILLQNGDPLVEALSSVETRGGRAAAADRGGRSARARAVSRDRPRVPPRPRPMKVAGTVRAPGDKSITHRALLLGGAGAGGSVTWAARSPRSMPAPAPACCGSWERRSRRSARATCVTIRGRGRLPRARPDARLRELGDHDAPPARAARRPSLPRHAHRRRLAAPPADATGHRSTRPRWARGSRSAAATGCRSPSAAASCGRCATRCRCRARRSRARCCSPAWSARSRWTCWSRTDALATTPSGCSGRFGFDVGERDGWIEFRPGGRIEPFDIQVPGDPSSAAFLVGAAVLAEGGRAPDRGRGSEPDPDRLSPRARADGRAGRAWRPSDTSFGEPVADLVARPAALRRHGGDRRRDPRPHRRDPDAGGARLARGRRDRLPRRRRAAGQGERPARAHRREHPRGRWEGRGAGRRSPRRGRRERRRGAGCAPPATIGSPWRSRCWARCPARGSRSTTWPAPR